MKIIGYALTCAIGLAGLYFKVEYSGWVLFLGCAGLVIG